MISNLFYCFPQIIIGKHCQIVSLSLSCYFSFSVLLNPGKELKIAIAVIEPAILSHRIVQHDTTCLI